MSKRKFTVAILSQHYQLMLNKRSTANFTVGNIYFLLPIFRGARTSFFRVLHTGSYLLTICRINLHRVFTKLYYGNSLVLHCASPGAYTIATSKVAVIFTSRLKIIMAPFVVLILLIAILRILPGQKGGCLETRPSSLMQNDHLKPKLSLCCRFEIKREP